MGTNTDPITPARYEPSLLYCVMKSFYLPLRMIKWQYYTETFNSHGLFNCISARIHIRLDVLLPLFRPDEFIVNITAPPVWGN